MEENPLFDSDAENTGEFFEDESLHKLYDALDRFQRALDDVCQTVERLAALQARLVQDGEGFGVRSNLTETGSEGSEKIWENMGNGGEAASS